MRCAISRACLRSCASSSWKLANTIWSIQRIRPHGVSLAPGSRGIAQKLPGARPSHSALERRSCIAGREEGPDPARLAVLQVHDHRDALLLLPAVAVGDEDGAVEQHGVVGE